MGAVFTKQINHHFFKTWNSEMAYVLGYIVADGCITVRKEKRKNPYVFNITSAEKAHLYRIRRVLKSEHAISVKRGGSQGSIIGYHLQICNPTITQDLMDLGIKPRKTYNLGLIGVPDDYFSDFVRGFFDGDGTVYIYDVNNAPQIKAGFVGTSLLFLTVFNERLCAHLGVLSKTVHCRKGGNGRMPLYDICFYIDDCQKLGSFMYENEPKLYLPRKRRVFERWQLVKRRAYVKNNYPSKLGWHLNSKNPASC